MRFAPLVFFFFFCLTLSGQKSDYNSAVIPDSLTESANAVIRVSEMNLDFKSAKDLTVSVTFVVTVLNSSGDGFKRENIHYNPDIKIKKAEIVVYNAQGKEIKKYKKKDFWDRSAVNGGTLYSDDRELYVDYTPVTYPYTFETKYEYTTPNTFHIPNWRLLSGYYVSTEYSKFVVNYNPSEIDLIFKEQNLENHNIEKVISSEKIQYKASGLKAIPYEQYSPYFIDIAPFLFIAPKNFHYDGLYGSVSNWNDFGKWFYENLLTGRDELPETTIDHIRHLTRDIQDPVEKAKIVYDYVQKNTRYVSVQVGIGGFQPIKAADVDKVKYGDCKGLTNYTKALLEAVGVDSYYTHIEAGSVQVGFIEDFPSIEQGNHVILAIPLEDDYAWIDCTSQKHPFGFIGDFNDNRNALVMKPQGGEIVKTASYLNEQNAYLTNATYRIDNDGSLIADIDIESKGIFYDRRFYRAFNPTIENIKQYKKQWSRLNNVVINSFDFDNDKNEVSFSEKINLKTDKYASKSGDRLIMTINAFNNDVIVPNKYSERKLPVKFRRGYLEESHYTIHLPEEYSVEAIPSVTSIETKYGKYDVSIIQNKDHTLTYKRTFFIKEGNYPKEDYEEFRSFLQHASLQDNAKIVLLKTEL
tara:strand:- start:131018 stop:132931 length:1914 start_codon:yes stop_codon:yes gene_type:complete